MSSLRQATTTAWLNERTVSLLVFAFCLLCLGAQQYWFIHANSATIDEYVHIQAGYRYWECGEFLNNPEHPPLFKWVAGFPIRNATIDEFPRACGAPREHPELFDPAEFRFTFNIERDHPELLIPAREAVSVFALILLAVVFFGTRSFFGDRAAVFAAILCTFEPVLIANGSLVTSDMALSVCMFATVWAAIRCADIPSQPRILLLGLALGLCLASKHSAIVVPIFVLAVLIVRRALATERRTSMLRLIVAYSEACVVAIAILWSFYGFRYSVAASIGGPPSGIAEEFRLSGLDHSLAAKVIKFCTSHHLLPEAYLTGLGGVLLGGSRPTYLFGHWYEEGFWYYFPLALSIKLTIGLLVLFVVGLASKDTWRKHWRDTACLLLPAAGFMAFAMTSKLNIGVRHVLPVVPFMIVIAAIAAARLSEHSRRLAIVCALLVLGSIASSLRTAPHQLSYANEFVGGPNHLYRYLGDSNVDWGQASGAVTRYLSSHRGSVSEPCAVAPATLTTDLKDCLRLPTYTVDVLDPTAPELPPERFEGTLIVQPMAASMNSAYLPYLSRTPDEISGNGTILVFHGSFDFREMVASRRIHRASYFVGHDLNIPRAISELMAAVPDCPMSRRVELETMLATLLLHEQRIREANDHAKTGLAIAANRASYARLRVQLRSVLEYTSLALGE